MVSCPTWSKNIERTLAYSTHVEKSTFNLAWLTDIMGQTSGEGCIYIFRNSHKICIPLGQSKMLILLWQVLPSIKWNLLGQSLLWKNLHEQSLLKVRLTKKGQKQNRGARKMNHFTTVAEIWSCDSRNLCSKMVHFSSTSICPHKTTRL